MKDKKMELINENSSPLFRIMSVYNSSAPNKAFSNNICAFHIGKGIIVSVAHNLRALDRLPLLLSDNFYRNELYNKIGIADRKLFDQTYPIIPGTTQRIATGITSANGEELAKKLDDAKVDRRYSKLYSENCCKPFLVLTFRNNAFCGDDTLNVHFPTNHLFPEPSLNRHTFLIELELLDAFVNEDIAIYKVVNTPNEIINKLPSLEVDFKLHNIGTEDYYCLQSAPFDNLGRIINEARIEGLLDTFSQEVDILENQYILDGIRYLIKGYFRFGSSGAPYLIYDRDSQSYKVNAVQSQASHIQLAINGNMEGNFQFVNGVATPLSVIEEKLKERLSQAMVD
ncbi:MAG: hypothetical protein RIQ59_907 [Bacteroidota bacterium]|jgi:hypothetical protein